MGVDQYMIMASYEKRENLSGEIKSALGQMVSVTEQSDAWVCFDIEGSNAKRLFKKLCVIDIDMFKIGNATRTMIDHLGCYVMCLANEKYRVLAPRSSAGSFQHAIVETAKSLG